MTVLEAMNVLGLEDRPSGQVDLELAMAKALKQTPRQRELLEEAGRCLSADLETSRASHMTSIERYPTREILLFDENRDAVMFGDASGPELPVAFHGPLVDDAEWMGDDSVIFEGEAAMMSEVTVASAAPPEPIADVITEKFDAPPLPETSVSGEWQLMLESLEADGLVKPEEGFSDALSAQMVAEHDAPPERLTVNSEPPDLNSLIFAALEPDQPALPAQHAALLTTPLFSTPLLTTPLLSPAQPETPTQPAFSLETPLFASSPMVTFEQSQVITFDESLLISHGGSLTDDSQAPIGESHAVSINVAPINAAPTSFAAPKTLETLPSRKAPEATQLSIKPAAAQPSEQPSKQVTGRAGIAPSSDATRIERRSSRSAAAQPVTPRTYRDAREQPTQVRRRRQPVAVWLLSVAALLGSAVFIAPNLAAQLRDSLLSRTAAPTKPGAGLTVKPPVRVVKPASITPPRALASPAKAPKPAVRTGASKPSASKPGVVNSSVTKPSATKPGATKPGATKPSTPRAPVVVTPLTSAAAAPKAASRVKAAAPVKPAPRATVSSASSLPPVTRPEGFASSAVTKPATKPVVAIKPKPAVKPVPKPAPPPAPVASIEYQDKPSSAATSELPGGLSRQEFGRQFLNRKQFEVWQSQQLGVRFESFAQIPLETQVLEAEAFRAAVLIPTVRPTRPERP